MGTQARTPHVPTLPSRQRLWWHAAGVCVCRTTCTAWPHKINNLSTFAGTARPIPRGKQARGTAYLGLRLGSTSRIAPRSGDAAASGSPLHVAAGARRQPPGNAREAITVKIHSLVTVCLNELHTAVVGRGGLSTRQSMSGPTAGPLEKTPHRTLISFLCMTFIARMTLDRFSRTLNTCPDNP